MLQKRGIFSSRKGVGKWAARTESQQLTDCAIYGMIFQREVPRLCRLKKLPAVETGRFFFILGGAGDISHLKLGTEMWGGKRVVEVFPDTFNMVLTTPGPRSPRPSTFLLQLGIWF